MGKSLKGKELGIGISQRKDGLYTARFTDRQGKRRQKYFKKLQECRNWLADMQFQDEHGNINVLGDMTVDAWFDYWIENIKGDNIRRSTRKEYESRYRTKIKEHIGNMLLSEIKPFHCQNILNQLINENKTSTINNNTRGLMYSFFESAVDNELIKINPIKRSVKVIERNKKEERRVLTREEQKLFLEYAKKSPHYNQYAFVLQTGLRVSEVAALRWQDIDFTKRIMSVKHSLILGEGGKVEIGDTKTMSGQRDIPLTDEAINILKEQKKKLSQINVIQMEFRDFVFLNKSGKPINRHLYNRSIETVAKRAGIKRLSIHTLRHTFATRCIEGGMKPKTLQMLLGHSDMRVTMGLYVHITEDEKFKEMHEIENMLVI